MNSHTYIACDLGAESGRIILGTLQAGLLTLAEVYRFPSGAVQVGGSLHWDIEHLRAEIMTGLSKVSPLLEAESKEAAESISVDSWGVDYVLADADLKPLGLPFHYRDTRTDAPFALTANSVSRQEIFAETGIQFLPFNTLYQLIAHREQAPAQIDQADSLLLIADYFHALLSGTRAAERSIASTTQLYNPVTAEWSQTLTAQFELPLSLLPPVVDSGTRLGSLLPSVAAETGLPAGLQVIATCSHDTGAAVAAVPEEGSDWAFLSSGTWSLLGVELPEPLINGEVLAANFTNEVGWGGTTRLLKNIAGLWIIQECRRTWLAEGGEYSYDALTKLAAAAAPLQSLIHPADQRFLAPGGMPDKVRGFCRETGQPIPQTPGLIVRCALESLALSYRQTLEQAEKLTGRTLRRLHVVGGGCQNALLCQFAANATGRVVVAGPVEATAIGNVLLQAVSLGHLSSVEELRRTVRNSFPLETYLPADADAWDSAYTKFQSMETMHR